GLVKTVSERLDDVPGRGVAPVVDQVGLCVAPIAPRSGAFGLVAPRNPHVKGPLAPRTLELCGAMVNLLEDEDPGLVGGHKGSEEAILEGVDVVDLALDGAREAGLAVFVDPVPLLLSPSVEGVQSLHGPGEQLLG